MTHLHTGAPNETKFQYTTFVGASKIMHIYYVQSSDILQQFMYIDVSRYVKKLSILDYFAMGPKLK